jgi:succinate dehydrogenase / fumarate reductase membrane anchor subunit
MSWRAQGLRTWIMQRLTAVYMVVYLVGFAMFLPETAEINYETWRGLFGYPLVNIATGFFSLALLYHAWVGVRDILIDYVRWGALRFSLWVLVTAGLSAMGVWTVMILIRVVEL